MSTIGDDEIVLRHIPAGTRFVAPGPRITRFNFQVRVDRGETGVSVTRQSITSADQLLAHVTSTAASRVAAARVGDLRLLGLDVVGVPLANDPGHAEIRSASADLDDLTMARELARVFQFLDPPASP